MELPLELWWRNKRKDVDSDGRGNRSLGGGGYVWQRWHVSGFWQSARIRTAAPPQVEHAANVEPTFLNHRESCDLLHSQTGHRHASTLDKAECGGGDRVGGGLVAVLKLEKQRSSTASRKWLSFSVITTRAHRASSPSHRQPPPSPRSNCSLIRQQSGKYSCCR